MAEPRRSRRKRGWLLANVIGGVVLIVALSFALQGSPGSGGGTPSSSALRTDEPLSRGSSDAATCTQFEQMVGACTDPTTTTTTAPASSSDPSSRGAGGGTTTYYTTRPGTASSAGGAGGAAPTSPAAAPDASSGTPFLSADPGGPCSGTAPPVSAPSGGWHCTLDDEFNGSSLDSNTWSPMTTYGSDYKTGPLLSKVCYVNSPQTISESGGYLNLSVIQTPQSNSCPGTVDTSETNFLGGMVDSFQKFSQQYGFFEARASMPPSNVPGLQATLWLYPENETLYGPWPDSGEIDYAEWYSEYPNNDVPAVHYPGANSDPNAQSDTCVISGQSPAGQFHTYALLWTPTTMTTYYDGVPCMTDVYGPHVAYPDAAPGPFNQPFFLNFTAALGDSNGNGYEPGRTPLPATLQVDWMRVWQYG
ncbi:MAG TPA: glycoside hydrolase family 16 protein [Acidimicrobiales bacterium]|nr:glycoside hydrolase family 16 protein [Acidimicrobiales bacterium]